MVGHFYNISYERENILFEKEKRMGERELLKNGGGGEKDGRLIQLILEGDLKDCFIYLFILTRKESSCLLVWQMKTTITKKYNKDHIISVKRVRWGGI